MLLCSNLSVFLFFTCGLTCQLEKRISLIYTCFSVCVLCRNEDDNCAMVFAHQTKWQRRMLQLYGEHMCLIDATYKTTIYDMPLFFLCVLSNVGYLNVATFLLSDEKQTSIADALQQISQ